MRTGPALRSAGEAPAENPARADGRRAEQPRQVTAECGLIAGDRDDRGWVPGRDLRPHLRAGRDDVDGLAGGGIPGTVNRLSLIHISEPTRLGMISYAVFCLKKK